jgi:hypothetical protein
MSFPDAINSQFESRKKELTGKRKKSNFATLPGIFRFVIVAS